MTQAPGRDASALELRGIGRRFGAVQALEQVDLDVRAGTIHALLGENGAGKSTLMRIVYGLIAADAGSTRIFGSPAPTSVRDAVAAGVGMVHQHLSLVPRLTAAENLVLGERGRLDPAAGERRLLEVSEASGLSVPRDRLAADLSIVEQQRLEILKALARGARLLILDEPTAVLAPAEVQGLLDWIRRFSDSGGTVVLVTHKLREALAVAHHVTVLRRGRVVHRATSSASTESTLATAIFPDASPTVPLPPADPGEVVVRAQSADIADARQVRVRNASFALRRGEIVGIAAIEGSGHRDLLRALARLNGIERGTLELPAEIALIPSDRADEGLIAGFTLTENVALRGMGTRRGLMPWPELASRTARIIERFSIAAPAVVARAATLSGGNQQRLVVGRELETAVDLVVADNPTRGLDLRATSFVHEQLRAAAIQGAAVVVHSSDLDEVLSLATRILVVFDGVVSEVSPDRDTVGRAMLGAA